MSTSYLYCRFCGASLPHADWQTKECEQLQDRFTELIEGLPDTRRKRCSHCSKLFFTNEENRRIYNIRAVRKGVVERVLLCSTACLIDWVEKEALGGNRRTIEDTIGAA